MARARPYLFEHSLEMYARLFTRRDLALLMDRSSCWAYAAMFTPPRATPVFHTLPGYCMATSSAHNLMTRLSSPLLPRLSAVSARLDEAGLTHFWGKIKVRSVLQDRSASLVTLIHHVLKAPFL